jgi:hypothetical protein
MRRVSLLRLSAFHRLRPTLQGPLSPLQNRTRSQIPTLPLFSITQARRISSSAPSRTDVNAAKAKALNQKDLDKQEEGFNNQIDNAIGEAEELQVRTPWHRQASDEPPVKKMRRAGAMTKGLSPSLIDTAAVRWSRFT